jgi:hypothetical protein
VLYFVFKSGDLGGKPIGEDLLVLDCSREYVYFNLSHDLGSLLLV